MLPKCLAARILDGVMSFTQICQRMIMMAVTELKFGIMQSHTAV